MNNGKIVRLDPTTANSGESECNTWFSGFAAANFSEAGRQEDYEIDWSGVTKSGNECVMELKTRKYRSSMPTAFIEGSKLLPLIMACYYDGKVPFYINRWTDNVISVHRLLPTDPKPIVNKTKRVAKNPGIKDSDGKATVTESLKCELLMDDAWLYDATDYHLKRKPIRN